MAEEREKGKQVGGGLKAFYVRQFISLIWMLMGLGSALLMREQIPWLKENIEFPTMALIGGAVGIVIPNVKQFGNAGRLVTRGENEQVNVFVGAAITILLLLLFSFVVGQLAGS